MTEEETALRGRCSNPNCTVAETGICLEGHKNYETECPYYGVRKEAEIVQEEPSQQSNGAQLEEMVAQEQGRRFWAGSELGIAEASAIMRARYTHLVGLVGPTAVGKTCFLNALYLKAGSCDAPLNRYRFAGSSSLNGFEERAKYARVWEKGQIPEKLSERTRLLDPRQAGFMHLRLVKTDDSRLVFDVLLTDLPGEWFETVIDDVTRADRLMFLQRADGILFFVDAERLLEPGTRHQEVHTSQMLLGRLQEAVRIDTSTPFVLLISKIDAFGRELPDDICIPGVEEIYAEARERSFDPSIAYIASFSRCPPMIPNGYGVEEALDTLLDARSSIVELKRGSSNIRRSFAQFEGFAE